MQTLFPSFQVDSTDKNALDFIASAKGFGLSVDTETDGRDVRDGTGYTQGVSVSYQNSFGFVKFYFPFNHKLGFNYENPLVFLALKDLIEGAPRIVFHNAKFDLMTLRALGIDFKGEYFCTMIMAHLINENWPRAKGLDDCVKAYVDKDLGKEMPEDMKKIIDNPNLGWGMVSAEMMENYARTDAELPLMLIEAIWQKFTEEVPGDFWDWKRRFTEVVAVMESRGILIDKEFCEAQNAIAEQAMFDYHELLGWFKPSSPKDMNELLCVQLGLPPIMRERKRKNKDTGQWEKTYTQTFDNAAMAEYEKMLEKNPTPIAEYVLGFRGWQKASTAFYSAYLRFVSPDGRLRPTYHHHKDEEEGGTVTGRLSCSKPNLQQIPRSGDKPWNGNVKKAFKAMPGYSLYEVDYSQLELRLGTVYAEEQSLIQTFNEGRDIFEEMAEAIGQTRQDTKTFVYMTQYGAGPERIAKVLHITVAKAEEMRDTYYAKYPGFRRINQMVKRKVEQTKKIRIWSGRYRHFLSPKDGFKAMNSMIQGGSADIVERQMVRVFDEVDQKSDNEVRMLLTVHDSVWFEIKDGTEDKWLPQITAVMEDVAALNDGFAAVKFAVDVKKLS